MKTSFELHEAIKSRVIFPEAIILPCELISKKGFFPVCTGTFDGSIDLSDKRLMIVGQDFGKVCDANNAQANGEDFEKVSTWKQMLQMLEKLEIHAKDCFFTNYLMGVRNSKTNMGPSPGLKSKDYVKSCLSFFEYQVEYIKPDMIVFLGKVAYYLSHLGDDVNTKLG